MYCDTTKAKAEAPKVTSDAVNKLLAFGKHCFKAYDFNETRYSNACC